MSDDPNAGLRSAFAANTYKLGVVCAALGLSADSSTDNLTAAARSLKAQLSLLRTQVEALKIENARLEAMLSGRAEPVQE
jgi:hypothetical protein